MRSRWTVITLLILAAAGGLVYVFTCTPLSTWVFGMGKGCPEFAHQWREAFAKVADPDEARERYPTVMVKHFHDGAWVFGICADSHSSPRGGTVVLKDSTGRVRAFFGHVCGDHFFENPPFQQSNSLEEFYQCGTWQQFRFREYEFPRERGNDAR